MSDDGILEVVAIVSISGVFGAIVATLVGVPVGGLLGRSGSEWIVRAAAFGVTHVVTPVLVVVGVGVSVAGLRLQLAFTVTVMVLVQVSVGLPIVIGSTARAIGALPPAAIDQVGALRLSRYHETRILIREVLPEVVASTATAFAVAVVVVGGALVAGAGVAGETKIATPIIVDQVGGRPVQTAGFLLIGLAAAAALSRLPIRRLR